MRKIIFSLSLILSLTAPLLLGLLIERDALIVLMVTGVISFIIFTLLKNGLKLHISTTIALIFIYLTLIIVPYSYYITWFQISNEQIPPGVVTATLCQIITVVWVYYMTKLYPFKLGSLIYPLIILTMIVTFFIQEFYIFIVFYSLLILVILLPILFRNKKRYSVQLLGLFLLIFTLSSIIFDNYTSSGSKMVNSNSYKLRLWIKDHVPFIELLTSIPGIHGQYKSSTGKPPILTNKPVLALEGEAGRRYYLRFEMGEDVHKVEDRSEFEYRNRENSIELTVIADFLPVLPTLIDTIDSNYLKIENTHITQMLPNPLLKGSKITLYQGDPEYKEEDIVVNKPKTNDEIKLLATQLKGRTPRITALNIRNYLLSDDFFYSVDVPESSTYIEDFLLENKVGFCVHYTRSFKLLAELNDIPVREVTGYLVDIPRPGDKNAVIENVAMVSGLNAHLWPEIYLDGKWMTFEVTKTIYRESEYSDEETEEIIDEDFNVIEEVSGFNPKLLLLLIPILLVALLLYYNLWYKNYLKRWIHRSKKIGISHPKYIGWIKWCEESKVDETVKKMIIRHFYDGYDFTSSDIRTIKKEYRLSRKKFKNSR